MRELPSGTVTLLFTDIEGSTRLLHELGERRYAAALTEHRRILRDAFAHHHGVEVDIQGDAFFVAFPTAEEAIAAALRGTESLASGPIRARIGLHTGTPLLTPEGYVGMDVHRAARIAAAGHGGQVLVSEATALLIEQRGLRDLGEHRFKDLAAPERVYQVGDEEFPPLKSLYHTNLPVPATAFLGRALELVELVDLLTRKDMRVLSLTGPGGIGKTRLALQAAAEATEAFPAGVWWVPLAALRDPSFVLPAVAQTFGLKDRPDTSLEETLASELAGKQALLVLDNCEHLMPEVADIIGVLRDLDGPTVLVTSRERLRIRGEQAWPVPTLGEEDATSLFVACARSVDPSFTSSPAVAELCTRLDELPLAVELAAARTALFTPAQLLKRLGQRLDLFRGHRDADPRQQTLRSTIEWSYHLLTDEEKDLFERFSVFVGGCTFEAAEGVCGAEPDALQSLLDKSLLRRRDDAGPRYWMLETLRAFSRERLSETGQAGEELGRHAAWYAAYAAGMFVPLREDEPGARASFLADLENVRASLAFSLEHGDARTSGDCLFGLWFLWLTRGMGREAAAAADRWLALNQTGLTPLERMPGLLASGEIVRWTGDPRRAADLGYETLSLARTIPDQTVHGWEVGHIIPALLSDLAHIELANGHMASAHALAEEAVSIRRGLGVPVGIGHALEAMGTVELVAGNVEDARGHFLEGADALFGTSDVWEVQLLATECAVRLGELEAAARGMLACLDERDVNRRDRIADIARVAGLLALEQDDHHAAATLAGAFAHALEVAGIPLSHDALLSRTYGEISERLRPRMGDQAFERALRGGTALTEEELLELAERTAALHPDGGSL